MIKLIFVVDENITKYLVDKFELKQIKSNGYTIYKNSWIILIACSKEEKLFREAFIFWYSEYNPEFILFVWEWTKISTDIRDWDIILPNVFFELDEKLNETEFDVNNRDKHMSKPIFLEQYNLQKDYNFENFWLSIWWICLTSIKTHKDALNIENARIAYEPDIFDTYAYYFVDEAHKLDLLDKIYVVLWASSEDNKISLEHISHIVAFLFDNVDFDDSVLIEEESWNTLE